MFFIFQTALDFQMKLKFIIHLLEIELMKLIFIIHLSKTEMMKLIFIIHLFWWFGGIVFATGVVLDGLGCYTVGRGC